ncbi:MAG: glycosyltransferase [Thermosipho sp. (in: Bacteria)]|nr:glycosyltransferase [Thermosipho sp. (in: thermotogales)]
MERESKISILTVTLNSVKTLKNTISSVIKQTYNNYEHIIVDGGSFDGTLDLICEYARKYPDKVKWISEKDSGIYDALNKAIKMSTGDIISILHSDDQYFDAYVLEEISNIFKKKNVHYVFSDVVHFKDKNGVERVTTIRKNKKGKICLGWIPSHTGLFLKREVHDKLGFYRTDLKIAADYDFMLKLFTNNELVGYYYPRFTIKMRDGGASTSGIKSIIKGNIECYKILKENGYKIPELIVTLKILRKIPKIRFFKVVDDLNSNKLR